MHVFICSMQETTSKSWRRPCQTPWVTLECSWNMAARKYWSKNQHSFSQKYRNYMYLSCDWRILTLKLWDCLGLPEVTWYMYIRIYVNHVPYVLKLVIFILRQLSLYFRSKADDNGAKAHIHPSLMNSAEQVTLLRF